MKTCSVLPITLGWVVKKRERGRKPSLSFFQAVTAVSIACTSS